MAVIQFPEQSGLEIIGSYLKAVAENWLINKSAIGTLYRGHANASWAPIPSAFRPGLSGLLKPADLTQWRAIAQRFTGPGSMDDLSYLVLAQHYGIPTALLDWTVNPLTALFFACSSESTDEGAVGAVIQISSDLFDFNEYTDKVDPFGSHRLDPVLIDTSAMNIRSTAQDSFMSLHEAGDPPMNATLIFAVEPSSKYAVLSALRLVGLTPERVYADLGVAATRFRRSLSLQALIDAGDRPDLDETTD